MRGSRVLCCFLAGDGEAAAAASGGGGGPCTACSHAAPSVLGPPRSPFSTPSLGRLADCPGEGDRSVPAPSLLAGPPVCLAASERGLKEGSERASCLPRRLLPRRHESYAASNGVAERCRVEKLDRFIVEVIQSRKSRRSNSSHRCPMGGRFQAPGFRFDMAFRVDNRGC